MKLKSWYNTYAFKNDIRHEIVYLIIMEVTNYK